MKGSWQKDMQALQPMLLSRPTLLPSATRTLHGGGRRVKYCKFENGKTFVFDQLVQVLMAF